MWGPAPGFANRILSNYVLFVNDCTRMCWVFFLKHKSEVFSDLVTFYKMRQTQFHAQPQILRFDNGGNTSIMI